MKLKYFIFFYIISLSSVGQDSTTVKPKFNYLEFNINSANYVYTYYDSSTDRNNPFYYVPYPTFDKKIRSFNSVNAGVKLGRHKLTIGLEISALNIVYNNYLQMQEELNNTVYKPNFKANYYYYLSKKHKRVAQFLMLNFNTQTIKDHLNNENTLSYFEYKKGFSGGLGYGATFYIKKHFLIEPSILVNALVFKDKQVYKKTTTQILFTLRN